MIKVNKYPFPLLAEIGEIYKGRAQKKRALAGAPLRAVYSTTTPFFRMMFAYSALSPVMMTAYAFFARS